MALPVWSLLSWVLLHHDPNAAEGASGFRAWLGEAWVHQISVTLHATGALLVAGGLAAVLLMRSLRSDEGWTAWNPQNRAWVRAAVLGGWVLNFLGGAARLFQPDHPGLDHIADVAWVQVLLVKHLALLAAIGFSLLAIELGPEAWTRSRLRQHAVVGLVLVLFASVSGGVSTGLPLPGMDQAGDDMDGMGEQHAGHGVTWRNVTVDVSGATPLTPKASSVSLDIAPDTTEIFVELQWNEDTSVVWAEAYAPDGSFRTESGNVSTRTAELAVTNDLEPGTWTIMVKSDRAVADTVQVTSRVTVGGEGFRVLEETVTISRGFEINLYMDPGDYFNYSWSLASGDSAIDWDIHSHPGGEVVYHHEGRDTEAEGNFTAGPHEVYSIYWRPDVAQSVTLTYRVEGNFTVHSIYR